MGVFRVQNNTPQIYQSESRDFQILSRAMDIIHGAVMGDIASMRNLDKSRLIYDSMLNSYASRVGFFPNRSIDAKVLRYILAAFPYVIKNKGTKKGILQAITTVIKAENNVYAGKDSIQVDIDQETHTVVIGTIHDIYNKNALEEFLKYIIPTGYDYQFITTVVSKPTVDIYEQESYSAMRVENVHASGARPVSSIDDAGSYNAASLVYSDGEEVGYGEAEDVAELKKYISSYSTNVVIPVSDVENSLSQQSNNEQQEEQQED